MFLVRSNPSLAVPALSVTKTRLRHVIVSGGVFYKTGSAWDGRERPHLSGPLRFPLFFGPVGFLLETNRVACCLLLAARAAHACAASVVPSRPNPALFFRCVACSHP